MNRSRALSIALFGCVALLAQPSQAQFQSPAPRAKPARYVIPPGWDSRIITVKFRDGLRVRLRGGSLTDLGSGHLAGAQSTLEQLSGGVWTRAHALPEDELDRMREQGERNVGFALHDLNLQFRWEVPSGFEAARAIDLLNGLEQVEMAEALPLPALLPSAPDYRGMQRYNGPSPRGTGATSAWGLRDLAWPGSGSGAGANVRIADIEYGFNAGHLDLPFVSVLFSEPNDTQSDIDHGTAVLGQMLSLNDGIGTTGGAYLAQGFFSDARGPGGFYRVDQAITECMYAVQPGGVILIEQQIAGPNYTYNPQYPARQLGLVPVEWSYSTWIAIRDAVAYGVHVIEAAGNGNENLDHAAYSGFDIHGAPINGGHWPFLPDPSRNSGAILVGAGASPTSWMTDRSRLSNLTSLGYEWGSNYGSRLDVQAYGDGIVTTGYGLLQHPGGGPNDTYTDGFGGTSGASPSVTAAAAIVQSRHLSRFGVNALPDKLRSTLRTSGSPQTSGANPSSQRIGSRVDVMAALLSLQLYDGMEFARGFEPVIAGLGIDGTVSAMVEYDDDGAGPRPPALYIGGTFTMAGGLSVQNIAKWTGSGWEALGSGLSYGVPWATANVRSMVVHDPDGPGPQLASLFVGGYFSLAGGVNASCIARWNGTSWSGLGSGLDNGVFALASLDEDGAGPLQPSLIAGGDFTQSGPAYFPHIVRWRNNAWSALASGLDDRVSALEIYDADDSGPGLPLLVAGGSFKFSGFTQADNIVVWSGSSWSELGGGMAGNANQVFDLEVVTLADTQQQILFVGGSFWDLGGLPASHFGVWTGWNWFVPPGQPFDVGPFAMSGFDDGLDPTYPYTKNLYLARIDVPPSGPANTSLWRLDPVQWNWSLVNTIQPAGYMLDSLADFDEDGDRATPPSLFCGGSFQTAGPTVSANFGKLLGFARNVLTYCTGKVTSQGCTPKIYSYGTPSSSQVAGFMIQASELLNNKPGFLLYSLTGRAEQAFSGGTLCLQAPVRRSTALSSGGSLPPSIDCSGVFMIDMSAFAAGALGGNPAPELRALGQVVNCQFWGRDSGYSPPNNTMLSSALEYQVGP